MKRYIIGLDEGTTSARTLIYDTKENNIVRIENSKFKQYFPRPGWVEHDANEIWQTLESTMNNAITNSKIKADEIIGIGITNQRESIVAWNKKTGEAVYPSIVWQCRRTRDYCDKLNNRTKKYIKKTTGLIVDAYFSATKIKWLLENNIKVKKLLEKDNLCIGTIDSYITYKLTNGEKFITDTSNASRTMLFNINTLCWDKKLLKIFNIPENILPEVISNGKEIGIAHTKFGDIKIGAILGDQQASLFGQGCFVKGLAKATYGTGCFILSNTGYKPLQNKKMLSTIAWTINNETTYALEGSIFNAGTVVNFMIDNLNLIESNNHSSDVAKSIKNTNGLYFVPAFTGMGAPYWNSYATGSLIGLTRGTEKSHIIRAGLESMAYNTLDIINCMEKEEEINIHELRVDGGVSRNEFLMQFQADMLNKKVSKSESSECTVLGVIYLTGLSLGFYKDITEIKKLIKQSKIYINKMNEKTRKELYQGWQNAVKRTIGDIK